MLLSRGPHHIPLVVTFHIGKMRRRKGERNVTRTHRRIQQRSFQKRSGRGACAAPGRGRVGGLGDNTAPSARHAVDKRPRSTHRLFLLSRDNFPGRGVPRLPVAKPMVLPGPAAPSAGGNSISFMSMISSRLVVDFPSGGGSAVMCVRGVGQSVCVWAAESGGQRGRATALGPVRPP